MCYDSFEILQSCWTKNNFKHYQWLLVIDSNISHVDLSIQLVKNNSVHNTLNFLRNSLTRVASFKTCDKLYVCYYGENDKVNIYIFQVENLLISSKGFIKLCDFGSATTETHYPDETWSAMRRSLVEDEVCI
jgi:serine/threonine protein kinase